MNRLVGDTHNVCPSLCNVIRDTVGVGQGGRPGRGTNETSTRNLGSAPLAYEQALDANILECSGYDTVSRREISARIFGCIGWWVDEAVVDLNLVSIDYTNISNLHTFTYAAFQPAN